MTVYDLIDQAIEKACEIKKNGNSGWNNNDTALMKVIDAQVGYKLTSELNKHAEAAKEKVVRAMQERGADIIAQNLQKLAADERIK